MRTAQPRGPKYGRFQLNERFNHDQVPLSLLNGQSETWAPKGSKRVSIAQPFSGLEKRQCTIQPTIGPGGKLMRCVIVFRGTGKRISTVEKKTYDTRVDVFLQKNAWADRAFCMPWAEKCFRKSLMQGRGRVSAEQSLLTQITCTDRQKSSLRHTSRRSATRWCGFTVEGARTHCSPSMQALGHSSRSSLGRNSTYGMRTGTIWNVGRATR